MGTRGHVLIVVPLLIGMLTGAFAVLGYVVIGVLGIPIRLHMPVVMRAVGLVVLALGFVFMGWVFKNRN